ncbi:hypothetical protein [Streptomyces sp. NPDC047990]
MIPIPSLLAACQISATGYVALAGLAFLAVFGTRISDTRKEQQ